MKILYINSVYQYGSTGRLIKTMHDGMKEKGHESFVIYGRTGAIGSHNLSSCEEKDVFRIITPLEQKADISFSLLSDTHGLHSVKNTEKMIAKIREIEPDLIHLHNIHGFYVNYPRLFSFLREYGRPVVWTLHDCWSFTGFCSHFMYHQCSLWQSGCKDCRYRDVYPYRILSHAAENFRIKQEAYRDQKLYLVTPSAWLKDRVQESMLGMYPCEVIYNDVDLKGFYFDPGTVRQEYDLNEKRIYLSVSGIWTKQKGLEECVRLAKRLTEKEVLVMIGLSDRQIRKLSSHPRILALGSVNSDALRHWYSSADAFFNPTLEDTFPTVNLEANACGAPIVAYRTGGSPESAGKDAAIVEPYDIDGSLNALRKAERKPVKKEEKHPQMLMSYMNLYERVIGV